MNPLTPIFQDEVQLAGWRESHTAGPLVTFRLTDPALMSVFRGMTVAKGGVAGHRLAMVLVEINDDETPKTVPQKIGPLALLAVQWCRDQGFQDWVVSLVEGGEVNIDEECIPDGCDPEEVAAFVVRAICNVESRRDIDGNPLAVELFDTIIRAPYRKLLLEG